MRDVFEERRTINVLVAYSHANEEIPIRIASSAISAGAALFFTESYLKYLGREVAFVAQPLT
ncbi:protein of unknown function (plasmid) [Caballeronia sp. S22]